jgi:CHASE3 domain sensor protein
MQQLLTLGAKISVGFFLALALLAVISILAYRTTRALIENNRWVVHTHEVLTTLEAALSQLIKDTETGQRGYLLSGEERYLKPYREGVNNVHNSVQKLQRSTADNPRQQQQLSTLEPLIARKLAELQETILLRTTAGLEEATAIICTDQGKQLMDQVRVVIE